MAMSDTCQLHGIQIACRIGVDDWEAEALQTITVDLHYPVPALHAARSDDLTQTVDYRLVADGVCEAHTGRRFQLVETLAESVAQWVLQQTRVAWVEVSATKSIGKTAAKTATIHIRRGSL